MGTVKQAEPEQFGRKVEADFSLTGNGIMFIEPDGAVRYLQFGADRTEIERLAAPRWGEPFRTIQAGCTVGQMEGSDYEDQRHMLTYKDGKFVGWVARPETEGPHSITRQMVQAEERFAIAGQTTSEPTFSFYRDGGTLSGMLTDGGPNGKVRFYWAGTLCQSG